MIVALLLSANACSPGTPLPRVGEHESTPATADASQEGQIFPDAPVDAEGWADDAAADPTLDAASEAQDPRPAGTHACPAGMAFVEGSYCPEVEQPCLGYLDPPGRYHHYRCRAYGPSRCLGARRQMRYCIDAREYTPAGKSLPAHHVSYRDAVRICGQQGKRTCLESEWIFACEGEEMRPYPYGFERDARACNADHTDIWEPGTKSIRDQRVPSGSLAGCRSPFGVFDLAGNVEELVASDDDVSRPVMKGAWWLPGRNHCRARQTFHNDVYKGIETGFRCCADP